MESEDLALQHTDPDLLERCEANYSELHREQVARGKLVDQGLYRRYLEFDSLVDDFRNLDPSSATGLEFAIRKSQAEFWLKVASALRIEPPKVSLSESRQYDNTGKLQQQRKTIEVTREELLDATSSIIRAEQEEREFKERMMDVAK